MRALAITALLLLLISTAGAVDINSANQAQLEAVRGVGPALAEQILEARRERHFAHWADFIARVPGVGAKRAAQLSAAGLTVGAAAYGEPSRAASTARP